ncbi:MAG TPA: phage tail protein [Chitinophagaceae bacterium]|nr:phage tail protein [Chitinophagaceae bacterium]
MGNYPIPAYHFRVDWGSQQYEFSEVIGLSMEVAVIEHRDGSSASNIISKLPGLVKYSNIILKRPLIKGDTEFFDWIKMVHQNAGFRRNVTITLLNEENVPVVIWKVRNAWPCKYIGGSLNATSNEVAMETIELTHEGLEMEK